MHRTVAAAAALIAAVQAQQVCTSTPEQHPALSWSKCTDSGCSAVDGSVVIDANWRWTHTKEGTNCYTGNKWDTSICTDGATCAQQCCVDGAEYEATYGIKTSGDQLSLQFVKEHEYGKNVGSRVYLMENDDTYQMFTLLGNEFTFDVDVSGISCGLNGALYFVSMDEDGGLSKYDGNAAGAKYGTGYCDSQCPRDVKFIDGLVSFATSSLLLHKLTSYHRPTLMVGSLLRATRTPVLAVSAHAALRWTSGRPTTSPRLTLPTLARTTPSTLAMATLAEAPTLPTATAATATPMAATSTPTARATRPSMVPVLTSPSTLPRR